MLNDHVSVTRLRERLPPYKTYLSEIDAAIADPFTGEPTRNEIRTVADIRKLGPDGMGEKFPNIGKRPITWLFKQLEGEA